MIRFGFPSIRLCEEDGGEGGDPGQGSVDQQAAPPPAKLSMQERIKAHLQSLEGKPAEAEGNDNGEVLAKPLAKPAVKAPPKPVPGAEEAAASAEGDEGDAGDDFTTFTELAERTGLTMDRLMDLAIPARVDGKEAKATLREMLKSYQLEGHLNTKLSTHASEVAAWKAEQQQLQQQHQQNLQRLDAGLQVAQRHLEGEFAQIDWNKLQQTDPVQYSQNFMAFQQRQAQLDQVAQQLGQERQTQTQQQQQQIAAHLQEQRQLLESKLPEWADEKTRKAALSDMIERGGKAYGYTAEEFGKLSDHRDFLVLNDALKWRALQDSKAEVVNKVRKAPALLKPGSAQSKQAQQGIAATEARSKLRKSGSVKHFAQALRAGGHV